MTEGTTDGADRETSIKIEGVEYGVCPHQTATSACDCTEDERCPDTNFQVGSTCYAPKRVQMGWICRGCARTCVVRIAGGPTPFCENPKWRWQPFYGKVVE